MKNIDHHLLELALNEDLGMPWHDATTAALFSDEKKLGKAKIISKHPEEIIICGIGLAATIIKKLDPEAEIKSTYQDGQSLSPGQTLLELYADKIALLKAERTILNFLRHLSAIATLTAKYVAQVKHTSLKILDTRKTTPGMRQLEKYAVQCGGGVNHRMGLYDAIMIKDTHVDMMGGMQAALAKLPANNNLQVIVEVRSIAELEAVMQYGRNKVNRVLLDNMTPAELHACVQHCMGIFATEASGNLSLENIAAVAATGVQYASIGKLTYAAGQVDLSMQSVGVAA